MADSVYKYPAVNTIIRAKRLGYSFWLPAGWLSFVIIMALCANLFNLPDVGYIDWDHPAALPGTSGTVTHVDHNGTPLASDYRYWLGTDALGRDIVTRLIFGARASLLVGLIAPTIALIIGGTLGLLAGFYRGRFEAVAVALMDIILAFPGLVLLLALAFYFGPGLDRLILALAILIIPAFFRVARANTLTWVQRDFIMAARAVGAGDLHLLGRHLLPNVIIPVAAYGLLIVAVMIIAEGAMSFLGLGVPAPTPSWGGMIAEGKELLDEAPHISLIPAAAMFLTVLSFNLLGDRLRELTDVRNIDSRA
jgi:peptide/nickel transport system permease protein